MPDGHEDFGKVKSATWLVIDTSDELYGVGHSLVLSTESDFCGKAEEALDQYEDVHAGWTDGLQQMLDDLRDVHGYPPEDQDAYWTAYNQGWCQLMVDWYPAWGDAMDPLVDDANMVQITVDRPTDDEAQRNTPATGEYLSDNPDDLPDINRWYGRMAYYLDNPYHQTVNRLEDVGCDTLDADDELGELVFGGLETHPVDTGTLTLEADGDDRFDMELPEASVDGDPGFSATATFERCDISVQGGPLLPIPI